MPEKLQPGFSFLFSYSAVADLGEVVGWPWGRGHRGWGDAQGAQDTVPLHVALAPPSPHLCESPDSSFQQQRLSVNPQLAGSQAGESWLSWAPAPFRGYILAREGQKKLLELSEMPPPSYGPQYLLLSASAAGNIICSSQAAFLGGGDQAAGR